LHFDAIISSSAADDVIDRWLGCAAALCDCQTGFRGNCMCDEVGRSSGEVTELRLLALMSRHPIIVQLHDAYTSIIVIIWITKIIARSTMKQGANQRI